jgi:la-related protein 1
MDKEGWIPISVIASFNRVKQLTIDAQLVKDVLTLSTVCQVKGEWVRMNEWRQFVLPTARESVVEESLMRAYEESLNGTSVSGDGEEEEEEEDVVFVMGDHAREWTPERLG